MMCLKSMGMEMQD